MALYPARYLFRENPRHPVRYRAGIISRMFQMSRLWEVPRSRTTPAGGTIGLSLGIVLLLAIPPIVVASGSAATSTASKLGQFRSHISHVIFLMQENRAYDNLFGMYCQTVGKYCPHAANGIPAGVCVPISLKNPAFGCVPPYNFSNKYLSLPTDLQHDWASSHTALNGGLMNGFLAADGYYSLGHYNGSTVPMDWDLAEEYGLGDNFFSGALSYSLPNHWYNVAPTAPNASYRAILGYRTNWATDSLYLNQSNQTPNIESELLNSSVSWRSYDFKLSTYPSGPGGIIPTGDAFDYWNPLAARAQSYATGVSSHFVDRSSFFTDAANGTLPNISWLIPATGESDHPPDNVTTGENWLSSVVDAVEASPDWNSTVLFISWDEYGGFYDHVRPPTLDANGSGFRVPLLAISPWIRQGVIDHDNLSFSSILHLMEKRFHLACLGARDCNARLPLTMFDFNRLKPRPPIYFGTIGNVSYPMPLQSSGMLSPFHGRYAPPPNCVGVPGTPAQLATIDWN